MARIDRPIVIGGGAAGLAACMTLEAEGHAPVLLEASERLGGRLRTEALQDGTPVDVGFQVLLTAYPELQRWTDFEALEMVSFVPGAMIHKSGRWRTLADPRRWPASIPATLTSGIGSWGDRIRILKLVKEVTAGSALAVQGHAQGGSTADFLEARGFSSAFIGDFLRPFFSGIFLDRKLSPPPAQFMYTLRMFATGKVVLLKMGMGVLVDQWASRLKSTEIRLGTSVHRIDGNVIHLEQGGSIEGEGIIDTVTSRKDGAWNGCFNAVFQCATESFGRPIIGLIPGAEHVTNLHFMQDVQDTPGMSRLNVTALFPEGEWGLERMENALRRELNAAGLEVGEMEWHALIPQALPKLTRVVPATPHPRNQDGVYVAGDHTAAPSLDAALRSGRVAAEAWCNDRKA
jgi:hypothetical protein